MNIGLQQADLLVTQFLCVMYASLSIKAALKCHRPESYNFFVAPHV